MMVDFFISRAGEDAEVARRIDEILRTEGYETFVQDKDFGHADFMAKMNDGFAFVDRGARLIAILSPAYLMKEHCVKEANHPLIDDPQNKRQKLIVFRVSECAPTGMLKALRYTDLVPHLDNESALSLAVRTAVSSSVPVIAGQPDDRLDKLLLLLETKDEQDIEKGLNWSLIGVILIAGLVITFNTVLHFWNEWFGTYYYPLLDSDLVLIGSSVLAGLFFYSYNQHIEQLSATIGQHKLTVEQLRELRELVNSRSWRSKNLIKSAVSRAIVSMVERR